MIVPLKLFNSVIILSTLFLSMFEMASSKNRISGSDTNPYLVFAANLAAGYLGIKNKLKPTAEMKKSVFGKDKSMLPRNVEEAVSLFENDDQINEVFNQKFVRTIAAIRRVENQAYLKVISSWEREYLLLNV